jgi:hypothetical protein
MATDATAQLIQRILSQTGSTAQGPNANLLSQADSIVSTAANYAQLLSTAVGPIAQASAIAVAGGATAATVDAAGQAAALTASAGTAGVGAVIVLAFSFLLAALSGDDSGSSETQALNQLNSELTDIENVDLASYWQEWLGKIVTSWNSPTGGLGTDLDNLTNEGLRGVDVKNDVTKFHDNALAFVNNLIPSKTPGAEVYWERPIVQSQAFTVKWVPYPQSGGDVFPGIGWYGKLPQPQAGPPLGGAAQQMALDPYSALPFLLLGIQSYLTIEGLVHLIDPAQPTFSEFLTEFKGDLQDYASFLYGQYKLAVNGIVKSDIPSDADVLTYLHYMADGKQSFPDNTTNWGGSSPNDWTLNWTEGGGPPPSAGYAWNGIYGTVSLYPQYGVYEPSPPVPVPSSTPACLIDIIATDNLASELLQQIGPGLTPPLPASLTYMQNATLGDWTVIWLHDKVILGTMARWKALYLINGYDKLWSVIQNLRVLSKQPPLPALSLDQDGTVANGNWSARELCTVVSVDGYVGDGLQTPDAGLTTTWTGHTTSGAIGGYSLFALAAALDNIAGGNWAGPPSSSSSGKGPSRPLGFRDRLAVAAVAGSGRPMPVADYVFHEGALNPSPFLE